MLDSRPVSLGSIFPQTAGDFLTSHQRLGGRDLTAMRNTYLSSMDEHGMKTEKTLQAPFGEVSKVGLQYLWYQVCPHRSASELLMCSGVEV